MLPLGHLCLAYLLYVGYAAIRSRHLPARWALLPVAIGSQAPDVIDKPLSYWAIIPSGRSLAHSLFTFIVVCLVVWRVTESLRDRWPADEWREQLRETTPAAFTVGYGSHLLGDSHTYLLAGELWSARFLLYPLYRVTYAVDTAVPPWIRLMSIYRDMDTHPQLELVVIAGVVFLGVRMWAWGRHNIKWVKRP